MKTRHLLTLAALCTGVLATTAMRGGCVPDPCPDLHIACPDLVCADGFQVDKNSCAICACAGEQTETCLSDADCGPGFLCAVTEVMPHDDARCFDGAEGERCGAPIEGVCVPEPEPEPGCFSDRDCAADEFCAMLGMGFETCDGDAEMNCSDAYGVCLPREQPGPCERLDEWSCIEDPRCEPVYVVSSCDCIDCFCADFEEFGGCVEAEPEPMCFDDADCAEGEFCALPEVDCLEGELDCGMLPGVCLPRAQPDPCAELDELSCSETPGCLPVQEEICLMYCASDEPDCACEPVFAGCVAELVGCFGAWFDEQGQCRAPNDGVYPAECCGTEPLPGQP